MAAIPKATAEAKTVPDAEPKSNNGSAKVEQRRTMASALPSKISQSVWDTSDNATTKVTGTAMISPYREPLEVPLTIPSSEFTFKSRRHLLETAHISPNYAKQLYQRVIAVDGHGQRTAEAKRLSRVLGTKGLQNLAEIAKVNQMDYTDEVSRCESTLTLTLTLTLAPLAHFLCPKSHSPHGPRCTPENDLLTRRT